MCHTEGFCHALLKKVESAGYKAKQWGAGSNRLFFLTTEFQPVNGQNDCEKQRIYKRKKKSRTTQVVLTIFCWGFWVCLLKLSRKWETSLVGNNSCCRMNPGKFEMKYFTPTVVFRNKKNTSQNEQKKHRIYTSYTDAVGMMASACDGWITPPRGKWEGLIHDEIMIQVLIEKGIAQLNSNCVFFTSSSVPTKTAHNLSEAVSLLSVEENRHLFSGRSSTAVCSCHDLWPAVLKVMISTSKQIANQWRGEDGGGQRPTKAFHCRPQAWYCLHLTVFLHSHTHTHKYQ